MNEMPAVILSELISAGETLWERNRRPLSDVILNEVKDQYQQARPFQGTANVQAPILHFVQDDVKSYRS